MTVQVPTAGPAAAMTCTRYGGKRLSGPGLQIPVQVNLGTDCGAASSIAVALGAVYFLDSNMLD